jgi:hypothetical protein
MAADATVRPDGVCGQLLQVCPGKGGRIPHGEVSCRSMGYCQYFQGCNPAMEAAGAGLLQGDAAVRALWKQDSAASTSNNEGDEEGLAHLLPKIMVPLVTKPGDTPRKVQLQRWACNPGEGGKEGGTGVSPETW